MLIGLRPHTYHASLLSARAPCQHEPLVSASAVRKRVWAASTCGDILPAAPSPVAPRAAAPPPGLGGLSAAAVLATAAPPAPSTPSSCCSWWKSFGPLYSSATGRSPVFSGLRPTTAEFGSFPRCLLALAMGLEKDSDMKEAHAGDTDSDASEVLGRQERRKRPPDCADGMSDGACGRPPGGDGGVAAVPATDMPQFSGRGCAPPWGIGEVGGEHSSSGLAAAAPPIENAWADSVGLEGARRGDGGAPSSGEGGAEKTTGAGSSTGLASAPPPATTATIEAPQPVRGRAV